MSSYTPPVGRHAAKETDPHAYIKPLAPRLILLGVLCIVVQALMGLSYMGAFGKPDAKNAPFIVVSQSKDAATQVATKLNNAEGDPIDATVSTDKQAAIEEVKKDHAVGAYVLNSSRDPKASDSLYYASAQGATRAQVAQTAAKNIAAQTHRTVQSTDVVKVQEEDARGTASFYLVLAWLVGAYLFPAAMSNLAGTRAWTARGARLRVALFAAFAVVSGLVGAALALYGIESLRGSYWQIAAFGAVLVFTVSVFTYGLTSMFGTMGIGIAILLFVILGNPSAGGAYAYDVLPEPWRTVGPYLPNGAGVDAIRSLSYFDGNDLQRPFLVTASWLLAGLLMVWFVGRKTYGTSSDHVAHPEDEAVGYLGEVVEHQLHILPRRDK